ncbi:NUDIX hydrolase [Actinomycetota bacterium]
MTAPPEWMHHALASARDTPPDYFTRFAPPDDPPRRSGVLMLFGDLEGGGQDVVLTERSWSLRSHAGQVSFPGGTVDPEDDGPVDAAVREAEEEVGVRPESVEVVGQFEPLYMTPTRNAVTPVLAWWRDPHPIGIVDPGEVATVERVPLAELLRPESRFTVVHPSGYSGPGFRASGLYIWGFTAMLLSTLFDLAGLTEPWDMRREEELPPRMLATTVWAGRRG